LISAWPCPANTAVVNNSSAIKIEKERAISLPY
jgi:hypothetical protein